MGDISISNGVRSNLMALQSTARMMEQTSERLSTGKRVNSALDNPANFFTASSMNNRAGDLGSLLDSMKTGVNTIKAADNALTSITKLVESAQGTARQALQDASTEKEASIVSGAGLDSATTKSAAQAKTLVGDLGFDVGDSIAVKTTKDGVASGVATITIDATTTAQDLVDQINTGLGAKIEAEITVDGKLKIAATDKAQLDIGITDSATGVSDNNLQDLFGATATINGVDGEAVSAAAGDDIAALVATATAAATAETDAQTAADASDNATLTTDAATALAASAPARVTADADAATLVTLTATSTTDATAATTAGAAATTARATSDTDDGLATAAQVAADLFRTNNGGSSDAGLDATALSTAATAATSLAAAQAAETAADAADVTAAASLALTTTGTATAAASETAATTLEAVTTAADAALAAAVAEDVALAAATVTKTAADTALATAITADATAEDQTITVPTTDSNGTREKLAAQFNDLLTQITDLAEDADFNGVNLLKGDDLTVIFNEKTGTSENSLTIKGVTLDASGLGLDQVNSNFQTDAEIQASLDSIKDSLSTLRQQASEFGSSLSVVETRQDFTSMMVGTLEQGASDLTLADVNKEGANMLALQTSQSLATTTMGMASQADQAVLSFLR